MENPIIVPFDLNTARKIKSGEIEGSVLINNIEIEFVYESKDCAGPYNLLFSSASIVAYEYKLLYHEKFFEHLHMKRLVIDENIPFPVSTWERSYRYKGYGYNMCRETKKKLLQAIKGVNVEEEDVSLYTTGGWD